MRKNFFPNYSYVKKNISVFFPYVIYCSANRHIKTNMATMQISKLYTIFHVNNP